MVYKLKYIIKLTPNKTPNKLQSYLMSFKVWLELSSQDLSNNIRRVENGAPVCSR